MLKSLELPLSNPVAVFLLVLLVILCAPQLMRRLKLPPIIGYILAGMAIGPYALNWLTRNAAVDLFATIGLLYIMFIAGLQLDLNDFARKRNRSLAFGVLTFAVPIAVGFPVCYYLLHLPLLSSVLTSSMFATHTLVAYPIITRYGLVKNEAVAVAVGGTILTDTAVLLIFSVIMGAHHGQLTTAFWLQLLGGILVFSLIAFVLIPRVAAWFFKRFAADQALQFVFVLAAVFGLAFTAQLAGLEAIIGAFVAGLTLNRLVPADSPLMDKVTFTGNSLFIPFFLISVGMLVDLRVLFNGTNALVIALTLTIIALIGKWLAAFITQRYFGYSTFQRKLLFGLSASHAAATMAIILVGFEAGIINAGVLNGTILLIMATCLVASFVTESAAKQAPGDVQ